MSLQHIHYSMKSFISLENLPELNAENVKGFQGGGGGQKIRIGLSANQI